MSTPQISLTKNGCVDVAEMKAYTAKQLNGKGICGYCKNEMSTP
jgi:hypothetical protein